MAYRSVKKINGRFYVYEQQSVRVGGKVVTSSRYLGALEPATIQAMANAVNRTSQLLATTAEMKNTKEISPLSAEHLATAKSVADLIRRAPSDLINLTNTENDQTRRGPKPIVKSDPDLTKLNVPLGRHGISESALLKEQATLLKRMQSIGLKVPSHGAITVTYGAELKTTARNNRYRITFPRWGKGNRSKFKTEYRKAIARLYLGEIARQRPDLFDKLRTSLDASYRTSQAAITNYVVTGTGQFRSVLTLHIWACRSLPQYAEKYMRSGIVTNAGARRGWQDEAFGLMAEIQAKGFDRAVEERRQELRNAQRREGVAAAAFKYSANTLDRLSGKHRKNQRTLLKATHERQAASEVMKKFAALRPLFQD